MSEVLRSDGSREAFETIRTARVGVLELVNQRLANLPFSVRKQVKSVSFPLPSEETAASGFSTLHVGRTLPDDILPVTLTGESEQKATYEFRPEGAMVSDGGIDLLSRLNSYLPQLETGSASAIVEIPPAA